MGFNFRILLETLTAPWYFTLPMPQVTGSHRMCTFGYVYILVKRARKFGIVTLPVGLCWVLVILSFRHTRSDRVGRSLLYIPLR